MSSQASKAEEVAALIARRQHGWGGASLAQQALMRHPTVGTWRANFHVRNGVWNKLRRLGAVEGHSFASTLTPLGLAVREHFLKEQGNGL